MSPRPEVGAVGGRTRILPLMGQQRLVRRPTRRLRPRDSPPPWSAAPMTSWPAAALAPATAVGVVPRREGVPAASGGMVRQLRRRESHSRRTDVSTHAFSFLQPKAKAEPRSSSAPDVVRTFYRLINEVSADNEAKHPLWDGARRDSGFA